MPPVPRFKTAAIADLAAQVRYAPVETKRRQMDRAERLVPEIEPGRTYPEEFIVYRVTGYRPERSGEPVMLVGAAIVSDLVSLVQHLSRSVALPPDHEGRDPLPLPEVRELNVSARTLHRYRQQGLICHYVSDPGAEGSRRLVCFADALDRFCAAHRPRLARAARFSRMREPLEARIVESARELRRGEGVSLNEAAARLAREHGRAHETIRLLLRRHDRRAAEPIFRDRGPLTGRERRLLLRAWRFGVPMSALATRLGRSAPAIHRVLSRARREALASLDLRWVELPTFALADAEPVILSARAVTSELGPDPLGGDALRLVRAAHEPGGIDENLEGGLLAGYHLLKRRANRTVQAMPDYPTASALDRAETDLRWATLLERRLVALALPTALRQIEQNLRRRLEERPGDELLRLLELAISITAAGIETTNPSRGTRLERLTAHAVDRVLAARPLASAAGRASARHEPESLVLPRRALILSPWQPWLDPRPDLAAHVDRLDADAALAVTLRYGWSGGPPLTIEQIAARLDRTASAAGALLRRAERALREIVRKGLRD